MGDVSKPARMFRVLSKTFKSSGAHGLPPKQEHLVDPSYDHTTVPHPSSVIYDDATPRFYDRVHLSRAVYTTTRGPSSIGPTLILPSSTQVPESTRTSSAAQTTKNLVKGALGVLSSIADGVPVPGVKGIFETTKRLIEVIEAMKTNQEELKSLRAHCQTLLELVIIPLKESSLEIPPVLQSSLARLESDICKSLADIENQMMLGTLSRFISNQDILAVSINIDQEISHFIDLYTATLSAHNVVLSHRFHQTVLGYEERKTIEKLPKVKAGYDDHIGGIPDRRSCFTGTREQLLIEIKHWVHKPSMDKPIYVLYGIAGIGKTTVAQTLAEYAAGLKLLGASFFFSRVVEERKSGDYFFTTLAFQLALHDSHLGSYIAAALINAPDISHKTLAVQIKHLIVDPIQRANIQKPVVLIVDALDECVPTDAKTILELLMQNIHYLSNVKVFITTRPEAHTQAGLADKDLLQSFFLHEIETSVAKRDIEIYLKTTILMDPVARANRWEPSIEDLKALVDKCGILFVMATTAVRYILDEDLNEPALQMNRLIKNLDVDEGEYGVMSSLDSMYLNILRCSIPKRDSVFIKNFQQVVGTIVVLEDLLPLFSLSILVGIKESVAKTTLKNLHSIMAPVSSNQAPQVYHQSFHDFITNSKRCLDIQFLIVPKHHHAQVAQHCFDIMDKALHTNMYSLQGLQKYMSNAEILKECPSHKITDEVQYSCLYWATHLNKAGNCGSKENFKLLHRFSFTHLLHWIEVLSLIGRLEMACPSLKTAQYVMDKWNVPNTQELNDLLNDGSLLVTKYYEIIKASASHVYYSALPFLPLESQVFKTYHQTAPDIATVFKGQKNQDHPLLATLEGHSNIICAVVFSPDGSRLASSSFDGVVKLWDGFTGAHIANLEGHLDTVYSVAFSSDGTCLASGSFDTTIMLWNGIMGTHIHTLQGHSSAVHSITFSPDGTRVISGSADWTVRLWNRAAGVSLGILEGHSDEVNTVTSTPDGSRLASSSDDGTIKLWHGITGDHITTLEKHTGAVYSVIFSPDSSTLASCSSDHTIMLWDSITGTHKATLEGHCNTVSSITFSPNGSSLASGSFDNTIKLWDTITGNNITTMDNNSNSVYTVVFSSNGSKLASGSSDSTIRIWDGNSGVLLTALEGHSSAVNSVAFSPNGSRFTSGSSDNTIKLWDGIGAAHVDCTEGYSGRHPENVNVNAFSLDGLRLSDHRTTLLWDEVVGVDIVDPENSDEVNIFVFSPHVPISGYNLALSSGEYAIKLWNRFANPQIRTDEDYTHDLYNIRFSPDGFKLASCSSNRVLSLWDGATGTYITTLEDGLSPVSSVSISLDNLKQSSVLSTNIMGPAIGTHASVERHSKTIIFSSNSSISNSEGFKGAIRYWNHPTNDDLPDSRSVPRPSVCHCSSRNAGDLAKLPGWAEKTINHHNCGSESLLAFVYIHGQHVIRHTLSLVPVLWLPPDFDDPYIEVTQGKLFVIGFRTGQVIFLGLP